MIIKNQFILLCVISIGLTACGGGGSSSGGDTSTTPVTKAPVTYTGTQTIILSGIRGSTREEVGFVLVLDRNTNKVTIQDEDFTAFAFMDSEYGTYIVGSPTLSIEIDATTTCTGAVIYSGEISPTLTNGSMSGGFRCGADVIALSGNYSATPGSAKVISRSLGDILRAVFRD